MGAFKWIFGAVGWAIGGYIGGILGYAIGSVIDGSRNNLRLGQGTDYTGGGYSTGGYGGGSGYRNYSDSEQRNSFLISMLVLSTAVMKADGKVLKSELNYVKQFIRVNFGENAVAEALQIIKSLLDKNINVGEACAQIKVNMPIAQRRQLFGYLAGIAKADGEVSSEEMSLLLKIATYLGISYQDAQSMIGMYEADVDPYKILEIDRNATDEEVRKAYRRLAVKFHPDKVESLGEDVKRNAEEQFKKIQAAYDQIKKERGMK